MRLWYPILTALLFVTMALGSSSSTDYARAEQFVPDNVIPTLYNISVTPNWIDGSHLFWYLNTGREEKEFVIVDTKNATKKTLFNNTALAKSLSKASGAKVDPSNLPFIDITTVNGQ